MPTSQTDEYLRADTGDKGTWRTHAECADPSLDPKTMFPEFDQKYFRAIGDLELDRDQWFRIALLNRARYDDFVAKVKTARQLCERCPVADPCLDEALALREPAGIRAGLTPGQRKRMIRHFMRFDDAMSSDPVKVNFSHRPATLKKWTNYGPVGSDKLVEAAAQIERLIELSPMAPNPS